MSFLRRLFAREKFRGFFKGTKARKGGLDQWWMWDWPTRRKNYEAVISKYEVLKSQILSTAGHVVAEGCFTEAVSNKPRHQEAKDRCDELLAEIRADQLIHQTAINMAAYGTTFWEKAVEPDSFDCRLIQEGEKFGYVIPLDFDMELKYPDCVTRWKRQNWREQEQGQTFSSDEIAVFSWNVSRYWPYGTPLTEGLEPKCEILDDTIQNLKDYYEKNVWPIGILSLEADQYNSLPTGSTQDEIISTWTNAEPGERIVSSWKTNYLPAGPGQVESRSLPENLKFIHSMIVDGTMMPPISMQYNSTEASAKVMYEIMQINLVRPMQRIIKRTIENYVLKPFLESMDYSVKTCPSLTFVSPENKRKDEIEYYASLVRDIGLPKEIALRKLGFEEELQEWEKEMEAKQAVQVLAQKVLPQPQMGFEPTQPKPSQTETKTKRWMVEELE